MTRSIVSGLLGLLSVIAIGTIPSACQSGGVGDPCTPEDEYDSQFAGFKVTEENIESRSFQCETRICLVNHFQGRVSCPMGQFEPASCDKEGEACPDGRTCKRAQVLSRNCVDDTDCGGFGNTCDGGVCRCESISDCTGAGLTCLCEDDSCNKKQCGALVCASEGCQQPQGDGVDPATNKDKNCCIPGTDLPVAGPVCAQCAETTRRDAQNAVYCSCRCGVAEGQEEDPNFNFCECPDGYECSEIRKDLQLGDPLLAGKYCIKQDTAYSGLESACAELVAGGNNPGKEANCTGNALPLP